MHEILKTAFSERTQFSCLTEYRLFKMTKKNSGKLSLFHTSGYNKQKYTEARILDGIINQDDKMFRFIYKSYLPHIKSLVYEFHTLVLDADDIFQDGLAAAANNVMENRFHGDCSFKTYLSSICNNICLKQFERANKMKFVQSDPPEKDETEPDKEELIYRLTILKDKMDEKCRQIIDLRFGIADGDNEVNKMPGSLSNVRFEEIAKVLDIEPDNARQRFKRCLEKLRETVFNDKNWNEILTNIY